MAIKLMAEIDDKKFVAAADRMAGKMNEVRAASKKASDGIDKDYRDMSVGSLEEFGKRMGRVRAMFNNVLLAGMGMRAVGAATQFAAETQRQLADEFKGTNRELYNWHKQWETVAKVARFDLIGAAQNHMMRDLDFDMEVLQRKARVVSAIHAAIEERNRRTDQRRTGAVRVDREGGVDQAGALAKGSELVIGRLNAEAQIAALQARETDELQNQGNVLEKIVAEANKLGTQLTDDKHLEFAQRMGMAASSIAESMQNSKAMSASMRLFREDLQRADANMMSVAAAERKIVELEGLRASFAGRFLLFGERAAKLQRDMGEAQGILNADKERQLKIDTLISDTHRSLAESTTLEVMNYQEVSRAVEHERELLRDKTRSKKLHEESEARIAKLLERQVAIQREGLDQEREQARLARERRTEELKGAEDSRKDRAERVAGAVGQLMGNRAGGGGRRYAMGSMIPGLTFGGPGIFGGPGVMGPGIPMFPGVEGGGLDFAGEVGEANQRGVRKAIRGRQDAIQPDLADIKKKFAEAREQRRKEFDFVRSNIDELMDRSGGKGPDAEMAARMADNAIKKGQAEYGPDGMLRAKYGDIDTRERTATQRARDDARSRRGQVPRQVREEMGRGQPGADIGAAQEAEFKKLVDEVVKGSGIGKENAGIVMAVAKAVAQLQADHEKTRQDGIDTRKIVEAMAANKAGRAFNRN